MRFVSEVKELLSKDKIFFRKLHEECVEMTDTERLQKLRSIPFKRNEMKSEVKELLSEESSDLEMTDTERLQKLQYYRNHIISIIDIDN